MTLFGGVATPHLAGFQNIMLSKQIRAQVLSRDQTLRGLFELPCQHRAGLDLAGDQLGHPLGTDPKMSRHLDFCPSWLLGKILV